eukprot:scaffold500099_cov19-Prasinocladus_malaysianus.AAC.1
MIRHGLGRTNGKEREVGSPGQGGRRRSAGASEGRQRLGRRGRSGSTGPPAPPGRPSPQEAETPRSAGS